MTRNPDVLPEIDRQIASLVIFSSDGALLMGRKDPAKGGVYPDAWHIPGGGVEANETLEQAARREGEQEVQGLDLSKATLKLLPFVGRGEAPKTLDDGRRVWCNMIFNRFEVHLSEPAAILASKLKPGDDLAELRWFQPDELATVQHIPGGKEFFTEAGYMH